MQIINIYTYKILHDLKYFTIIFTCSRLGIYMELMSKTIYMHNLIKLDKVNHISQITLTLQL